LSMIVTNRGPARPKRQKKPAQAAAITAPRIVKQPSKWERQRKREATPTDPETLEGIIQFFERMGLRRAREILRS
jgi:hypothetical protein